MSGCVHVSVHQWSDFVALIGWLVYKRTTAYMCVMRVHACACVCMRVCVLMLLLSSVGWHGVSHGSLVLRN